MFWSRNNTFFKDKKFLKIIKDDMITLLMIKQRSNIREYSKAFDYFVKFPKQFDGATIVKDLDDLPNLDLDSMLHDYCYIQGANKNFIKKWKADFDYIKNMERNGKGIRVFRLILLTLTGLLFVPYCKLFK